MAKQKYTAEEMADALRQTGGVCTEAAKVVGCGVATVWRYIDRYVTVEEARKEAQRANIEVAESKLLENIHAGDQKAIEYYLNSQGRERGYGDRKIHEFEGDYQIQILPPDGDEDE